MVCKCKMIISSGVFFHFFKNLILHLFQIVIFGVNSGVKGQKMAQNDQKLCVVFRISGSIHHMIVIFGTCVYK